MKFMYAFIDAVFVTSVVNLKKELIAINLS